MTGHNAEINGHDHVKYAVKAYIGRLEYPLRPGLPRRWKITILALVDSLSRDAANLADGENMGSWARTSNRPMDDRNLLQLRFDAFELDEKDARLSRGGQTIPIPPKPFAVLCALARQPGQLVTKTELLDTVWGHQYVSESVLKTIISELRAALSDDAKHPRYIETAARRGYRFIGDAFATPKLPSAQSSVLPTALPPIIVGRQHALAQLHSAWTCAQNGQRRLVWVTGDAGIGKTTLIDRFAAELGPAVFTYGQCVEQHGAGEPYLPVLEALGTLCHNDPSLSNMLRAVAPTWLIQMPWLSSDSERESLRRELAGVGQDRMLRELGELLERYTEDKTLLLVTEDLHWSDHATVDLINHIARRRSPARLMWLGTFRLAEVIAEEHPLKTLRHELRLHRLCEEIMVEPFSEQEVADFVAGRFPENEVSETWIRALHARTDGLPLFVVNVIDDLAQQGVFRPGGMESYDEVITTLQVPENLAGVIGKQISRLSDDSRTLLEVASVCGAAFDPVILAALLERDSASVSAQCDDLARQQQWLTSAQVSRLPDGSLNARYEFRHALYRQVFYQRLGTMACAQLHRRVAALLEERRATGMVVTPAELAGHYELSHDLMTALRYYAEATQNALRRFAPKEGMTLAQHSLNLLTKCPPSPLRDMLELTLTAMKGVSAAQLSGVSSLEAKHSLERAYALLQIYSQHPLRGLVLHALGIVLLVRGEYGEARALGEKIYALSQSDSDGLLLLSACSVLGQVYGLQGSNREAREWLERGVETCEALGDEALHAAFVVDPAVTIYAALSIPLLHLGQIDTGRKCLNAAVARSQRLGEPMAQMVAAWFGSLFEIRLGNADQVLALATTMRAIADESAIAQAIAPSRWFRGWADSYLGKPHDGYRLIRDAYDYNVGMGMYSGSSEVLCYAAEALALADNWNEARKQLDEAIQAADRLGEHVYFSQMLVLQGRIAVAEKNTSAARDAFRAAQREASRQGAIWFELNALVALVELKPSNSKALELLAEVCTRLTEGHETTLVRRAYALLGKNAHASG